MKRVVSCEHLPFWEESGFAWHTWVAHAKTNFPMASFFTVDPSKILFTTYARFKGSWPSICWVIACKCIDPARQHMGIKILVHDLVAFSGDHSAQVRYAARGRRDRVLALFGVGHDDVDSPFWRKNAGGFQSTVSTSTVFVASHMVEPFCIVHPPPSTTPRDGTGIHGAISASFSIHLHNHW